MSKLTEVNIVGRVSHFFAVNRPLSILVLIAALLFGLTSFWLTPKQYNPEITRPAFLVTLSYGGADTAEATTRVTYELIEKIKTVPGVDDVLTEVHDGAVIRSTVIFEVDYDATKAKLDLRAQLDQHSYLARGFIGQPSIIEVDPETIPVLQIVFSSDTESVAELRSRVIELSHVLGQTPDVSEVSVQGGYTPSLVIAIDPVRMNAAEISIETVARVLQAAQLRTLGGNVSSKDTRIELVFDAETDNAAAIGAVAVTPDVRIRDIADVYVGTVGERGYVLHSTATATGEVVMVAAAKVAGSSAPQVADALLSKLDAELAKSDYDGIAYQVVSNDGATAAAEISGLTQNLLTSIVIVAGVLLLFLSLRAAAVVLVAIPVTLLIVFGLGFLFDQTINRITLFALILSLGLLVDSAIVVVENIYSHLKQWGKGESMATREAVIAQAVHEIGIGLLLSTVTSVIVFLPMRYITGMMGPYMGPIAFFVPAALIVSLLVAIVITPFVAAHILRPDEKPLRITAWFEYQFARLTTWYGTKLRYVLQRRARQRTLLLGALFAFLVTLALPAFALVHFQMLPRADRDQLYIYIDAPIGTSLEATRTLSANITEVITHDPAVVSVQQFVATPPILDFNGMFKGAGARDGAHQASLRVNLVPAKQRDRSSTEITSSLRTQVATSLGDAARAVRFVEEPPGPPVMATVVAKVSADSLKVQRDFAYLLQAFIASTDGVVDEYTTEEAAVGRVRYHFDREAAATLGVSETAVQMVYGLLGNGIEVTEWIGSGAPEYTPLMLALPYEFRSTPRAIDALTVVNKNGETVPLSSVLVPEYEVRPSRVDFDGALPTSYVTAEVEDRSVVYVVIDIMHALIAGELNGYAVTDWNLFGLTLINTNTQEIVSLRWGGEWEMTLENFRDLGIAMGVALLMVYGVLVAQYNRFAAPAYILVTVPLGLVGILWGFLLLDQGFGIYLTATALIGFIALIGLVVNNAIIFLEYVEQMHCAGMSYQESLLAAGQARLRPIFLTSLTTVLGSLTIAGDPVWSGLAWAIVFGLSLSTVLTLVIYPTLLMYFVGNKN